MRMPLNAAAGSTSGGHGGPSFSSLGLGILAVAAIAVGAAAAVGEDPSLALTAPFAIAGAYVAARFPAAAVISIFGLTGLANTFQAHLGFAPRAFTDFILLALWLGVVWSLLRQREYRAYLWPGILFPAFYLLLTALEIFTSGDIDAAFQSFQLGAFSISAIIMLALAPWPNETIRRMARGAVAVGLVVGLYGLLRWAIGPSAEENAIARGALPGLPRSTELRFFGSFPTAQQLANWCATMAPFALALALGWQGRWRVIAAAAACLCAFLIIASSVLTGIFAILAGIGVTVLLFGLAPAYAGGRRLVAGVAAVAAVVVIASVGYTTAVSGSERSESKFSRILDPTSDPTFQRRQDRWNEALAEIDEHPFGHGLGTSGAVGLTQTEIDPSVTPQIDSSYLKIAYEQGILVMLMFCLAMVALFIGLALRSLSTTDPAKAAMGIGACGALVSLLVLFFAGLYSDHVQALSGWLLVGIGVAQFTSARRTAPRPQESTPIV